MTIKSSLRIALVLFSAVSLSLALSACRKKPAETAGGGGGGAAVDMAGAKKIFAARCAACHGKTGKGDGPGAKGLKPPPRDYTDAKWQASVTDKQLHDTILKGGLAVGKSALMPPNPDLKGKPAVLNGLVKIVRGFKK